MKCNYYDWVIYKYKRIIWRIALAALLLGFVFAMTAYLMVRWGVFGKLPTAAELRDIETYASSEVYAHDGELLGKYFIFDHSQDALADVSPVLIDALLATEDVRFYRHRGTDYRSIMRVLVKNILLGRESAGGGSTLTRQLVKNLFPRKQGGFLRLVIEKIKEGISAGRLERLYTKDEILILYLNTVPFGENVYGIGAASQRFFNCKPDALNLQESATLVGLLKANTSYNPRLNPEGAVQRRNLVIRQMHVNGFISEQVADSVAQLPLELRYTPTSHLYGPAPYFREMLRLEIRQLIADYNEAHQTTYNLYQDGLRIYTSIDYTLQVLAEDAVKEQMARLQTILDRHYLRIRKARVQRLLDKELQRTSRYNHLKNSGLDDDAINQKLASQERMLRFDWGGTTELFISPLDSIFEAQKLLHQGIVSIEPESGLVRVWVGGNDIRFFQHDHVLAQRQAGSAFKPFVYAAALDQGIDPCAFVSNTQFTLHDHNNWTPVNHDGNYDGYYSMRGALSRSVNTVSTRYLLSTGVNHVVRLARDAGITGYLPQVPSLALGTAEVSLLELTAAYAIFANGGHAISPTWLLKVEDQDGKILYEHVDGEKHRTAISEETALIMNDLLQSVVAGGTASSLRSSFGLYFDIAGKTGTTQNGSDGWFIGYTPNLVTGVWTGIQNPSFAAVYPLPFGSSGSAVPVWGSFMQKVRQDSVVRHYASSYFRELPQSLIDKLSCAVYVEALPQQNWLERLFGTVEQELTLPEPETRTEREQSERTKRRGLLRRIMDEIF